MTRHDRRAVTTVTNPSPLTLLQRLWAAVALGLVLVTVLVLVAATDDSTIPAILPAALTAAGGLAAVVGTRALDRFFAASPPADDATALIEFRQRAYLAVGIAEAPLLLGVALAFVLGPAWIAAVGLAGALAVLAAARPTTGRLASIDAAWQGAGADVSLVRAAGASSAATADRSDDDRPDGPAAA